MAISTEGGIFKRKIMNARKHALDELRHERYVQNAAGM